MTLHSSLGGCHCGNISFEIETPNPLSQYQPRACDCDFCVKHSASYLSDANGRVKFTVKSQADLGLYKQGSGLANFIICKSCGVLVGVYFTEAEKTFGAINSRAIHDVSMVQDPISVSPKLLSDEDRIARWKNIWFPNLEIENLA